MCTCVPPSPLFPQVGQEVLSQQLQRERQELMEEGGQMARYASEVNSQVYREAQVRRLPCQQSSNGKSFETTLAKDLTDGICQFIRHFDPD